MPLQTVWGSTVQLEVSSAAPDDTPTWVDLSDYLRPVAAEIEVQLGQQTELDGSEPGRMTATLDNGDLPERFPGDPWAPAGRLTSGDPLAPSYPWWQEHARSRVRETIAGRTFDLIDSHVEIPQSNVYMQPTDETDRAHMLAPVAAVDRLGRLQVAATFDSTLAAHILHAGGDTLRAYWPCIEPAAPFGSLVDQASVPPMRSEILTSTVRPEGTPAQLLPQQGSMPTGEDSTPARLTYSTDGSGTLAWSMALRAAAGGGLALPSMTAGQVLTAVVWINPDNITAGPFPLIVSLTEDSIAAALIDISVSGGAWQLQVGGGGLSGTIAGPTPATAKPYMIGFQYGYSPSVLTLWVDRTAYTGSLSGTPPTNTVMTNLQSSAGYVGSWGHAQVHVGAATDYTTTHLAAQAAMAWDGLERQTTGQRIHTLLDYAGVPAGMRDIDEGVAVMQRASLAGTTPGAQLERARATERGRLYVAGDGRVVFRDRRSTYF